MSFRTIVLTKGKNVSLGSQSHIGMWVGTKTAPNNRARSPPSLIYIVIMEIIVCARSHFKEPALSLHGSAQPRHEHTRTSDSHSSIRSYARACPVGSQVIHLGKNNWYSINQV